jgi:cellobiose phosphorylase
MTGSRRCSPRRSTGRRTIRGTSRLIRRASARTAASTHGAVWSIFAFAQLGEGDQAGALFAMLNPIHHCATPDAALRYRVEPYVACADVYSVEPHAGRGGWTWYTGSAGWLYRAGLEAILGFRVRGELLAIDPRLPRAWPGYEIVFRRRGPA